MLVKKLLSTSKKNMKNFPILKTSHPKLTLEPLSRTHLPFLVELLNTKEIQETLSRVPIRTTKEKQERNLDKMYEASPPKEITYILTLKKLLTKQYIGYVKIKLIDWEVMSCYLSVAILPDTRFRGKGYAQAAYHSFFDYLFSLGMVKIYGRTYEQNIPTIVLNEKTGFEFIGRQTQFILYKNKTSADALLFERKNPTAPIQYPYFYQEQERAISTILLNIYKERTSTEPDIQKIRALAEQLSAAPKDKLLPPLQKYCENLTHEIQIELRNKLLKHTTSTFQKMQIANALTLKLPILAYPITNEQFTQGVNMTVSITKQIIAGIPFSNELSNEIINSALYGGYTPENWNYLRFLFLGRKNMTKEIITALPAISKGI